LPLDSAVEPIWASTLQSRLAWRVLFK